MCAEIRSLRSFLNVIKYSTDAQDQATKRHLLLEFLQSCSSTVGETDALALSGLVQTWHFAVQNNNESLCSSVAACFALLLRSISSGLEFREFGNALCRTLLHEDQIKLFMRGMSAHKHKEHLINSCLRLLTEILQFDGGSAANLVYRQRETTFQRLDVFLSMRNEVRGADSPSKRRPSIRKIALHYVCANLRLQGRTAKSHILSNTRIVRSLLQDIAHDPSWTVHELLGALKKDILEDSSLSHSTKVYFFNDWTLGCLATLYSYSDTKGTSTQPSVKDTVHTLLLSICIPSSQEIRCHSEAKESPKDVYALSKNGPRDEEFSRNFGSTTMSKRHRNLLAFLKNLRPHANILQADLILECFRVAPILIDDYFSGKTTFSFDPKLTATWVGYSRFLLAIIQLPPYLSVWQEESNEDSCAKRLLSCILPQPLAQKVLTRCLNQSSFLVTFLTVMLLNAAFDKLAQVIKFLRGEQKHGYKRLFEASERVAQGLVADFSTRCPEMKHVISQFCSCPKGKYAFREALTRLLASYYNQIPSIAFDARFDTAAALSETIKDIDQQHKIFKGAGFRKLELDHLLDVVFHSPDMQWWHKAGMSRSCQSLHTFSLLLTGS